MRRATIDLRRFGVLLALIAAAALAAGLSALVGTKPAPKRPSPAATA